MDVDTALAEVPVNIMPLLDDTDFKTRETAVAFNAAGMDLVWNFVTTAGAFTQTAVTPTSAGNYDWTNQGDGMYTIEIPASGGASINNDTEGFGWFTGFATGVLPWRGPTIGFRAAALNNSLIDGATIDVNVTAMAAGVVTATVIATGAIDADAIADNAIDAGAIAADAITAVKIADGAIDAATFAAGAITATVIATGAIDADALAADAVAEIADGVWDEDATGHQTQGTFGQAIGDPGADADTIWGLANTNLDATVSSRASQASVNTIDDFLDTEIATIMSDLDDIQTRLPAALTTGTADSGTTTTMVDAARTEADTDYWKGCWIRFTSGNISGQVRLITDFTPASDTITFAPATTQAVATQTYEILPANRVDLGQWLGVTPNALISGRVDSNTQAMANDVITAAVIATDAITAAKIAADAIGASELAADAVTEIQSGLATAAALATVQADTDDIQTRLPAALVSGRMDSNMQAAANGVITAAVIATDAIDADALADGAITAATFAAGAIDNTAFNVTETLAADVVSISGDTAAADNLEKEYDGTGFGLVLQRTTIATLASQTSFTLTAGSADNDAYNECVVVIEDAATAAQKAIGVISDYVGATKTVTLLEDPGIFTIATTDIVTVLAIRAGDVWDVVLADHLASGSTGNALNAAGAAGDPWSTALPGAYGAGTAGKIVGDNLNATVGSRATQTSVDTIDDFLDTEVAAILADTNELQTDWANGGRLDNILDARASQASVDTIDTNVDSILADTGTDGVVVAAASKTGYALSSAGIQAIWDALTSALTTAGSIGKLLVDNINATISSRSSHAAADVWSVATRLLTAGTNIVLAKGVGVTGFNDLDAAGVRSAVGLAAANLDTQLSTIDDFLDTEIAAIKAKTDQLAFSTANQVDANILALDSSTAAATHLKDHSLTAVPVTFSGGTTTTAVLVNVDGAAASSTDDFYNGRVLIFTAPSGLKYQATDITDYVGATKTATITAVTTAVGATTTAVMV